MSGTVANIPTGYKIDLFLHFDGAGSSTRYYAAGDPNTQLTVSNGHWTGDIYIGAAYPLTILLVLLSPDDVKWINDPAQTDYQNNGFPSMPWTVLTSAMYTAQ
jgi:hypothetical protein